MDDHFEIAIDYKSEEISLDCEMLDAKIASALKKLRTHVHFRRRVSDEEQRSQKDDRFLRGRQIAYIIYEHFRSTGAL